MIHRSATTTRALLALSIIAASGLSVSANPSGGEVVEGEAEFDYQENWLRVLTGELTIIDWINFNIEAGQTVEFIMPGVDSKVLNRITSGVPTEIMGNLLANGQVFIVNPSGVIFGQGAVVNVGALYAAAGNISNEDFVAGVNRFTDARGIVENRGHLRGDLIALIGGRVANHGTISAPNGTVVMAAGEQVLIGEQLGRIFVQLEKPTDPELAQHLGSSGDTVLDLAAGDVYSLAAWNTGTVEAGSVRVHGQGGRAVVSGTIDASWGPIGGDITVIADAVELRGATIDASGDFGGGSVTLGGNPHSNINADRAEFVSIDAESSVRADGLISGHGGAVVVWSDQMTTIDGSISARGGAVSGDGGFIETSGLRGLRISRMVDARAANGKGGHWLIDPTNLIIAPGSLGSLGGFGEADTAVIGVNLINQALNGGMDVTLTTFNPLGNGSGEIVQMSSAPFIMNSGGEATLTLNAAGSILLHGGAFAGAGQSLNLVLNAGDPNQPPPADPFSDGRIEINERIDLGGGSLIATGNTVLVRDRNITDSGDVSIIGGDISLIARDGLITLGGDLTATVGGILLNGSTTLIDDVSLSLDGGTTVHASGVIRSDDDATHSLIIDADGGVVSLSGGVGDAGAGRLGRLDVVADLARVGGDVIVSEAMSFEAPVEVFGEAVAFDTGFGTAFFGDNIYASGFGTTDVAFLYDGDPFVGVGMGRTPFKFRGSIGVATAEAAERGVGGAFRNIRFGADGSSSLTAASFLFANAAVEGLGLTPVSGTDLSTLFQIRATESIVFGTNQKVLSFGSLSMTADGPGATLIQLGDAVVVGDLSLRALGADGEIRLVGRPGGQIDGVENEDDREQKLPDDGSELIALGSIELEGTVTSDGTVVLASENGGTVQGLTIEQIVGGVGIDRFEGVLKGTIGSLYAYDLAAFASVPEGSTAVLATALGEDPSVALRGDERLLASATVLTELGLSPRLEGDAPAVDRQSGPKRILNDAAASGLPVTTDRLSRRSIRRLTESYIALLGNRVDPASPMRERTTGVRQDLSELWVSWSGAGHPDEVRGFADAHDPKLADALRGVDQVVQAIELLELSPLEVSVARARFLDLVRPLDVIPAAFFESWFLVQGPGSSASVAAMP